MVSDFNENGKKVKEYTVLMISNQLIEKVYPMEGLILLDTVPMSWQ